MAKRLEPKSNHNSCCSAASSHLVFNFSTIFLFIFYLCFAGNYSCLVAHFYLKRSVSFHLIQSYLPSILIVAISWVSFWMDIEAVPGRISLGVITLLAVSQQGGQGRNYDYAFFNWWRWVFFRKCDLFLKVHIFWKGHKILQNLHPGPRGVLVNVGRAWRGLCKESKQ